MDSTLQKLVCKRVEKRKHLWERIVLLQYVLVLMDRIGKFGALQRDGVPGIWGHSYIRTYYEWVNSQPKSREEMEGGIATTYFVLRHMNRFVERAGCQRSMNISHDMQVFLASRTDRAGAVGIKSIDTKGINKIHVNLRHSCFAYLIMDELYPLATRTSLQERAMRDVARFIMESRSYYDLAHEWVSESWPVGGIAAFISAVSSVLANNHCSNLDGSLLCRVKGSILALSHLLAELRLKHLYALGMPVESKQKELHDSFPFWHPISGLDVLRIHSTLACLQLAGGVLIQSPCGGERLRLIKRELSADLDQLNGVPRFSVDGPESISAAIAMLAILLENDNDDTQEGRHSVDMLLDFIESRWDLPIAYEDCWTEFTAPLLSMPSVLSSLNDGLCALVNEGGVVERILRCGETRVQTATDRASDVLVTARTLLPAALAYPWPACQHPLS